MNLLDRLLATRYWGACLLILINFCGLAAQNVTVSGGIPYFEEYTIEVEINNPGQPPVTYSVPNLSGIYSVTVPSGSTFTIRPHADTNPLNGVSTYDLVLIDKHIKGQLPFTPFQLIAADANHSGTVDLADTTDLYKLILGVYQELPNNTSWRFVRSDYVFPNPLDPFTPSFPEEVTFTNLTQDVDNVNFIGIKIGDVNASVLGNGGAEQYAGLAGTISSDENNNCVGDSGEPRLTDWLVTAQGSAGTYYATTNHSGHYVLYLPTGTAGNFNVFATPPNALWNLCTDTVFNQPINSSATATLDFSAQAAIHCPALEVDLSALFLRRCFTSNYNVLYCNKGTATAENASVEITFDPFLEVQSSTIPWTTVNGNTYTFPIANVLPGACLAFQVEVKVSCDAELGQTHCSTAHIYPDSLCTLPDSLWSGANLELHGACQGNEIAFTVTNTGADMTDPVGYVVIEDIMIQMVGGSIQLDHDESETITLPANGSTWRLQMDQAPHHPSNTLVSAAVEGCGTNGQGSASLGIIPLFPNNNPGLFADEDCQSNVGAYDPNDKQGFPLGVGAPHYIPQGQEIEYRIRFQNTGTDTAFNIIVLDTLPNSLDLSTLRVGASSHPYAYQVLGDGIVQFLFANIQLPDSTVNEAGSHGFVKFTIAPKSGRPDGTVIENQAAIFFDFNAPVITNRTKHTLGSEFLNVSNVVFQPGLELEVFPNPTSTTATFSLKTIRPSAGTLRLFDVRGRLVQTLDFEHNTFDLSMDGFAPGLYFFRLNAADGAALAAGKIVLTK